MRCKGSRDILSTWAGEVGVLWSLSAVRVSLPEIKKINGYANKFSFQRTNGLSYLPALISIAHSNLCNHFSRRLNALKRVSTLVQCIHSERSGSLIKADDRLCLPTRFRDLKTDKQVGGRGHRLLQYGPRSPPQSACVLVQKEPSASYHQQCTTLDQFPLKGFNTH